MSSIGGRADVPVRKNKPKPEPDDKQGDLEIVVEVDPEHEWRCACLVKAGFTASEAFRLSINGADWHDAEVLLRKGATPEQILRILSD